MSEQQSMARGDASEGMVNAEVLLIDRDTPLRKQLVQQLEQVGGLVTATDDLDRALTLARQKFFSAIVLDLDTPEPGRGMAQLHSFKRISSASVVAVMGEGTSLDGAVAAFRGGAADVLAKERPDEIPLRLSELIRTAKRSDARDRLLVDTLELHEDFLRRMMDAFRASQQAQERASGLLDSDQACVILVVDDNPRTAPGLAQALGEEGYRCLCALNGGEALDYAGGEAFDVALVNEQLPDLPGSTVARTLRAQTQGGIVLIFAHPGEDAGHLSIVETEQTIDFVPELRTGEQLVESLKALYASITTRKKEKKYVQAFRQSHADFLRKFAEVRTKIKELLPDERR